MCGKSISESNRVVSKEGQSVGQGVYGNEEQHPFKSHDECISAAQRNEPDESAVFMGLVQIDQRNWVQPDRVVAVRDYGTGAGNDSLGCCLVLDNGNELETRESFNDTMNRIARRDVY